MGRLGPSAGGRVRAGVAALALTIVHTAAAAWAGDLTLAGGPAGSEYDAVARALESIYAGHTGVATIRAASSEGPRQNVARLAAGETALALVPCDVLADAYEGRGDFAQPARDLRVLAVLYPQALHVVARPGAGVRALGDLRGRRIALVADAGGAAAATAWLVLRAHGLGPAEVSVVRTGGADALAQFKAGALDALVVFGAAPQATAAAALQAGGTLLAADAGAIARLTKAHGYLHAGRVDGAAYGLAAGVPTVEVDTALAAGAAIGEEVAQDLAESLFAAAAAAGKAHTALAGLAPARTSDRAPIPIHRGARAWLEHIRAIPYPVQVYVGVYAYSISELDMVKGTFLFDGYIWFRWKGRLFEDSGGPFDFALVNGTIEAIDEGSRVIDREGWHRQSRRLTARLRGNFLLHDYPFDTQTLALEVEHRWQGDEKLVFVPDDAAATSGTLRTSFLSGSARIADWQIKDVRHRAVAKQYETDFGSIYKDEWQGRSSRYVFTIEVRRSIVPYAVKLLLPLVITVAMGFIVFWIDPAYFDAKICLAILALLSCNELHLAQAGQLPEVGYVVKADVFFIISYLMLCLCLIVVTWESALHRSGRAEAVRRLLRVCRYAFPAGWLLPIAWLFATS